MLVAMISSSAAGLSIFKRLEGQILSNLFAAL
jgi:hypothetical protein